MIGKSLFLLFGTFIALLVVNKFTKGYGKATRNSTTKVSQAENKSASEMTEYSRRDSCKLGFQKVNDGFIRPVDFRYKNLSHEEEVRLLASLNKYEQYSKAMKSYVTLRYLNSQSSINGATVRVFIDTVNGKRIKVRDNTAILDLNINKFFDMAGEFVLINLNKEGDKVTINYVIKEELRH